MNTLYESFENGLAQPWMFVSEKEAASDACGLISVFASPYSAFFERQIAMYGAGRNVGVLRDPELVSALKDIFRKCSRVETGQTVELTKREKDLIKACIEGSFFKPFYE